MNDDHEKVQPGQPVDVGTAFLKQLEQLKIFKRRGTRSPHKPLLLLLALGQVQRGNASPLAFASVEKELGALISEFGPKDAKSNASQPFWRLQNDGDFWIVESDIPIPTDRSGSPLIAAIRSGDARASFTPAILAALQKNPELVTQASKQILDAEFPPSLHEEIASSVGLNLYTPSVSSKRTVSFRAEVLRAYNRQCAICGYQVRLRDRTVGLEAAHIKWHAFNGPDKVNNGLALCPTHHKLFDLGAFTLSTSQRPTIAISREIERSSGAGAWLTDFSDKPIKLPMEAKDYPAHDLIAWHQKHVFKG
jgi:putative restriction endonuclease